MLRRFSNRKDNSKLNRPILFAAMGFATLPAFADYTVQLGLGFSTVDDPKDYSSTAHSNFEGDTSVTGARAYFGSVDTSNKPISKAGFMTKKSSITAINEIYKLHHEYSDTFRNESISQSFDSHSRRTQLDYRGVYDNVIVNLSSELIYNQSKKFASVMEAGAVYYILDNAAITGRLIRLSMRDGDDD